MPHCLSQEMSDVQVYEVHVAVGEIYKLSQLDMSLASYIHHSDEDFMSSINIFLWDYMELLIYRLSDEADSI